LLILSFGSRVRTKLAICVVAGSQSHWGSF
jgi:hypothetical protein